jgi:hypothetical protein
VPTWYKLLICAHLKVIKSPFGAKFDCTKIMVKRNTPSFCMDWHINNIFLMNTRTCKTFLTSTIWHILVQIVTMFLPISSHKKIGFTLNNVSYFVNQSILEVIWQLVLKSRNHVSWIWLFLISCTKNKWIFYVIYCVELVLACSKSLNIKIWKVPLT